MITMEWTQADIEAYISLAAELKAQPRPPLQDRPLQPHVHTLGGEHRGEPLPNDDEE